MTHAQTQKLCKSLRVFDAFTKNAKLCNDKNLTSFIKLLIADCLHGLEIATVILLYYDKRLTTKIAVIISWAKEGSISFLYVSGST